MDIGTPERYLQASWDILERAVETRVEPTGPGMYVDSRRRGRRERGPRSAARRRPRLPDRLRGRGSRIGPARALRDRDGGQPRGSILSRAGRGGGRGGGRGRGPGPGRASRLADGEPRRAAGAARPPRGRALEVRFGPTPARPGGGTPRLRPSGQRRARCGARRRGAGRAAHRAARRLTGDRLPPAVGPGWSVLCASFSGEDAEALACFEAAGEIGARRLAVSTGGPLVERAREEGVAVVGLPAIVAPEAAFGYFFVATAGAAAAGRPRAGIEPEIRAAAVFLREHAEEVAASIGPPRPRRTRRPPASSWRPCSTGSTDRLGGFGGERGLGPRQQRRPSQTLQPAITAPA